MKAERGLNTAQFLRANCNLTCLMSFDLGNDLTGWVLLFIYFKDKKTEVNSFLIFKLNITVCIHSALHGAIQD